MYYISQRVLDDLKAIGVKGDKKTISLAYKFLLKNGSTLLKEKLRQGKPINCWKIPSTCPDEDYSKILVDSKAYEVMTLEKEYADQIEDREAEEESKKKKGFCQKCLEFIMQPAVDKEIAGENIGDSDNESDEPDLNAML